MAATLETIYKQAQKLSASERKRLAVMLDEAGNDEPLSHDELIEALKKKVDQIEKYENPKRESSAKTAERIRKWNDRGYKL